MDSCRRNPLLVICILFIILTSICPSLSVARPLGGGYRLKKETHMFQSLEKDGVPPPCRSGGTIAPGDLGLYPISVKTQSGEKLELQLNPGDSVMNLRQFLLEAPETCFFLCYDLILHAKDGSVHRLEDYKEISEAADITAGGCSLEMVAALYDDRSISMRRRKKGLQAKSKKAQESRAKLPYNHTSSSRSFASRMSLMIDGCFGIGCISI
ncbi:hypothetical protein AAC387_Pa08g1798 [Persea americana]